MFLSNFIETTLGSVTKETSQYTKSLRKKIEDVDKKIKFSDTEWEENEHAVNWIIILCFIFQQ